MENTNSEYQALRTQRIIEKIILAVYMLCNVGITFGAMMWKWGSELIVAINACLIIAVILHVVMFRTYKFRAYLTAIMLMSSVMLYTFVLDNTYIIIALMITINVILGLYGIPEIIGIGTIATTCIMILQGARKYQVGESGLVSHPNILALILMVYVADITLFYLIKRQLETNERQQEIIEALREAEQSKDDFLTNVSHELRTPINTICGMSEIIMREDIPERLRDEVFDIQTSGKNLLAVVSDILDFTELQSGEMPLEEDVYDLAVTIQNVIDMSLSHKEKNQLEVIVDCDSNIPRGLYGDEPKIRRVIMNLVDNAMKFTEEGCVVIGISYRKTEYGINLLIKVTDTGIGMEQESMEKVFTQFSQADNRRNRQKGGIGLGLAISRVIVDAMGGFITVKSEPGRGSEIQFVIPQKVVNKEPLVQVEKPESINAAVWVDMEKFQYVEVRDRYADNIMHIVRQLGVKGHICRSMEDMKRLLERDKITHIFTNIVGYYEDKAFFDKLSDKVNVAVVLSKYDENKIDNSNITIVQKPFYAMHIAKALNKGNKMRQSQFTAPGARVLLVDDNAMNIRVLQGLLKPYKMQVDAALSGMEALDKVVLEVYDLILLDYMMPEMDGVETLHGIRESAGSYYQNVPVIAVTANTVKGAREMFLEEGFQEYVPKPVAADAIARILERYIPERKKVLPEETEYGESNARDMQSGTTKYNERNKQEEQCKQKEQYKQEEQYKQYEQNGQFSDIHQAEGETQETEGGLKIANLDVEKGLIYCGTEEDYLEIISVNWMNGQSEQDKICRTYEQEDWKNYTIYVHGLKSAMMSIGAVEVSNMALELERAGKEGRIEYIHENHGILLKKYRELLEALGKDERINPSGGSTEDVEQLPKLDEDLFDCLLRELEEATYTLDADIILGALNKFGGYQYHGASMDVKLEAIRHKVEMSDYMAALASVQRMKEE